MGCALSICVFESIRIQYCPRVPFVISIRSSVMASFFLHFHISVAGFYYFLRNCTKDTPNQRRNKHRDYTAVTRAHPPKPSTYHAIVRRVCKYFRGNPQRDIACKLKPAPFMFLKTSAYVALLSFQLVDLAMCVEENHFAG